MGLAKEDHEAIARAIVDELRGNPSESTPLCKVCGIDPQQHREEHQQLGELLAFFAHVNEIKWEFPKRIIQILAVVFLIALFKIWDIDWLKMISK